MLSPSPVSPAESSVDLDTPLIVRWARYPYPPSATRRLAFSNASLKCSFDKIGHKTNHSKFKIEIV